MSKGLSKEGAYTAADRLDKIITEMLKRRPVTAETGVNWLNFTRSVRSTLDIIDAEVNSKMATRTTKEDN